MAIDRRDDARVSEAQLRFPNLCVEHADTRGGAALFGAGGFQRRLGAVRSAFTRVAFGVGAFRGGGSLIDLCLRDSTRIFRLKRAKARQILTRFLGLRARTCDHRFGALIRCLAAVDLRLRLGKLSRRECALGLRLLESCVHVARVDLHEHVTGVNELVVGRVHLGDPPGNLRCQAHDARIDERIIGAFEAAGVNPEHDRDHDEDHRNHGDRDANARSMQ